MASIRYEAMNPVFGTCVHADPAGVYAFFRVEGQMDDHGNFMRINQSTARRQFPNRGTVRTSRLPANARYGTFTLELDPRFERQSGEHNATKFRGLPTASLLYQIIEVPEPSVGAALVGNELRSGVKLLGEITARPPIFVLFSDNVLCGPVNMKGVGGRPDYFVMDQQEWARPKPAWRNITVSNLVSVDVPNCGETIFATLPLRDPDTYLDFAATDFSLRKVLEAVQQCDGASAHLTNTNVRELSSVLAKITPSDDLKSRIAALGNRLSTLDIASSDFSELLQRCLSLPSVKRQIEEEASRAKKAALAELTHEQRAASETLNTKKAEIANLSSELTTLSNLKTSLEAQVQNVQADIQSSQAKFAEAVAHAARSAENDVVGFLAQVAVLRPFIAEVKSHPETGVSGLPFQRFTNEATQIRDLDEGVKKLNETLKSIGVEPRTAYSASIEIISALSIGQAVAFRGSLSSVVATVVARTLSGRSFTTVEIPVGTRLHLKLHDLTPDASSPVHPSFGVLINGANRSCIDAYGGDVVDTIRLRLGGLLKRSTPPHVFLSLREGPSALCPTPQLAEIAPILHTDLWNWSPRPEPAQPQFSQLETEYKPEETKDTTESLEEIRAIFKDFPCATFSACVRAVLPVLMKFHGQRHTTKDNARDAAVYSLVNSWLLPFLFANRATEEHIDACIELAKADSEMERHVKLLKASQEC
jgi:hypothetical protein